MKKNVYSLERFFRFFIGLFLVSWGLGGGPGWSFVGLYLLATGSWGYCPIYKMISSER